MKIANLFLLIFSISINSYTQNIIESTGWLESAVVKWEPVVNAQSYNVYYTGEGIVNRQIDTKLIRSYGTYFRADILGLKAGTYVFAVKPVIDAVEGEGTISSTTTVLPHDRTGFAFSNGRIPGAYKLDGTPKDNAVIIYITQNTKNNISMNVVGVNSNPCVGLQSILDGFKKGDDLRPLIVRLIGQITDLDYMLSGDIVIENDKNALSYITFEGVGDDATVDGWGIRIKNATNIEIRNIGLMNCDSDEGDNIGLQQNNDYIWVHNVDFFYGHAGSSADQIKGDGALDCKKSTYVTFSYNHFWDTGKSNLLGLSENTTTGLYITYHHNWYDHSDSRHPRVRFYSAHVYNNYYDGIAKYGVGSTEGSSVFVESNYFRNCKYPMLISMQGSDVYNPSTGTNDYEDYPTFSSEDGGIIKSFDNYMTGQTRFVPYNEIGYPNPTIDFDAVVVSSRNENLSNTIHSAYGNNTYNNFDTNTSIMYTYTPDTPEMAKDKTIDFSGRFNGGDFQWVFNNDVDDISYAVNQPLKDALTGYETSLVYIQGETVPSTHTLVCTSSNASQNVDEDVAIEEIVFLWGGDATDVIVNGIPSNGLIFVKDETAKTITISGTPNVEVDYSILTVGSVGTPISLSGSITITTGNTSPSDEIHNFTLSLMNSSFYNITGNMNSTDGYVEYDGLILTKRFKIESSTSISYTTTALSTLTLVFDATFNGTIKLNNVSYTATNGIVVIPNVPIGSNTITKGNVANLFYIKTEFNALGQYETEDFNMTIYPNPVTDEFQIHTTNQIENVFIYNLMGTLVKNLNQTQNTFDISDLSSGSYILIIKTNQGYKKQIILKN